MNKLQDFFCMVGSNKSNQIENALTTRLSGLCPQFEIFNPIVGSDSISMMNMLEGFELSPKRLLYYQAMFFKTFPAGMNRLIAVTVDSVCFSLKWLMKQTTMIVIMVLRAISTFMLVNMTSFSINHFFATRKIAYRISSLSFNFPLAFKIAVRCFYRCVNRIKSVAAGMARCRVNGPISLAISKYLLERHKLPLEQKRWPAVVQENPRAFTADQKTNALTGEDFLNIYILAQIPA